MRSLLIAATIFVVALMSLSLVRADLLVRDVTRGWLSAQDEKGKATEQMEYLETKYTRHGTMLPIEKWDEVDRAKYVSAKVTLVQLGP